MKTSLVKHNDNFRMIELAQLADTTKAQYTQALKNYLAAGRKLTSPDDLIEYSQGLPKSSKSFLKAAVRLVTKDTIQGLKSSVTPETLPQTQAALLRLEALNSAIEVKQTKGTKTHSWLSPAQVQALMHSCDDTLTGRRDWVVLACLVGAGLRREELTAITCESLRDLPGKNGKPRWVIDVKGKGDKDRTIPIKPIMADRLRDWCKFISQGQVARSLGRKKELGASLSAIGIFDIVRKHGKMIGKPNLQPHDLRRTYAQLGYEAGVPLTQLSKLLGHSNVNTTQLYLNLDLNLETTVSDFIPLE